MNTDHCSECACSGNGVITSPGFPQNYANNLDLTWLIQVPPGQLIEIVFVSFETENSVFNYDSLSLYDGDSNTAPKIGEYSGSSIPPSFISSTNAAFIHFQSDGSVTRPGFKLEYHPYNA